MRRYLTQISLALLLAGSVSSPAAAEGSAVAKAMNDLRWGMSSYELTVYLRGRIKKLYDTKLKKASGYEKERLEREASSKIKDVDEVVVEFDGRSTRWDRGMLAYEFTHNNGESMLVIDDGSSSNYYFFMNNSLWKWYKVYNPDVFRGTSFKQVSASFENKFGKGVRKEAESVPGSGMRPVIEWRDRLTRMRAIDESAEYGRYCLVFEELSTVGQLSTLRANPDRRFAYLKPAKSKKALEDDDSDQSYETAKSNKAQAADSKAKKSVFAPEQRSETDEEYQARRDRVLELRAQASRLKEEKKVAAKRAKTLESLKGLESDDPLSGL